MSEIKAWGSVAQQLDKMNVDVASMTAANVSQASGDVFFVGRPNQDGQTWSLKKITPEEMGKLIYNYLTSSSVAAQLAAVLGVPKMQPTQNPDNLASFSICYCIGETSAPKDYFICFTLLNATDGAQLGIGSDNLFYYRFKINGVWKSWKTVSGT